MKKSKFLSLKVFLVVLAFLNVSTALTAEKPSAGKSGNQLIYGPEWTFTNKKIKGYNAGEQQFYFRKLIEEFKKLEEQGLFKLNQRKKAVGDNPNDIVALQLVASQGINIDIKTDPGVFEVQVSPLSLEEWKKHEAFFQKNIFDVFKKVGLVPHEREGAGHINIGLEYFLKKRNSLAERFVIDYLNHPGVGVVLNSLTANQGDAASLDQQIDDMAYWEDLTQEELYKKLKEDAKNLKILSYSDRRYGNSELSDSYANSIKRFIDDKFVAIGLRDYDGELKRASRFEMRQLRPQKDMKDYIKALEIFEARIKYLETQNKRPELTALKPIADGWVYLGQFADYLAEAGLGWQDYKSLMPEVWRDLPEKNFIRKTKINARLLQCKKLF